LTAEEWCVAGQAALLSGVAALAVRCLGVERAVGVMSNRRPPERSWSTSAGEIARIAEFVTTWLGARCLTQALVLQSLLARRGIRSAVVLGAALDVSRFRAHAWLERDGCVLSRLGPDGCLPFHRIESAPEMAKTR
jgi:Transglutaminase-like superfamily